SFTLQEFLYSLSRQLCSAYTYGTAQLYTRIVKSCSSKSNDTLDGRSLITCSSETIFASNVPLLPAIYKITYRYLDIKDLWRGEVTQKRSLPREQRDCALSKYSSQLNPEAFEFASDRTTIQGENLLQSLEKGSLEEDSSQSTSLMLKHCQLNQEMEPIVGSYQHEYNENFDVHLKAADMLKLANENGCGTPYDGSKNKYDL
ncbi:uncharacterized protein LOC144471628, partial [Augochlora pura]